MPLFSEAMENHALSNNYGFSAVPVDTLGASEYTLALIVADTSGSVSSFKNEIEACIKRAVAACRNAPRADNLMLRMLTFNNNIQEFHGFKPLMDCAPDHYTNSITPHGSTALFDATYNGIESVLSYGKTLVDSDYDCNAIVIVITDGDDNASTYATTQVRDLLATAMKNESLESMVTILVGVNVNSSLSGYLKTFKDQAGFTQYIELDKADEKTLAKLSNFISKSISNQSQALGTGGPSVSISF
jgi:uncharacterized protein YegL